MNPTDTVEPPSEEPLETTVGQRLRALRKQRDYTVNDLAARATVSAGMISQIERGMSNPSIRVLERLRQALNVPLTTLLDGSHQLPPATRDTFVRRKAERPHFTVGANGISKQLLSPNGEHDLQFMFINIAPHSIAEEVLIGPGEKAGWVLEGQLELTVADQVAVLDEGDSFQFSSLQPHSVRNRTDTMARVLWIMNTKRPVIHL
jgi:transcriptional regulator with XRE-family HTH domain